VHTAMTGVCSLLRSFIKLQYMQHMCRQTPPPHVIVANLATAGRVACGRQGRGAGERSQIVRMTG